MRVAVLGGGPAGALAAERLAAGGAKVTLLDEKLAWEKPCGGGLTYKAYQQYPFLVENDSAKRTVTETVMSAPGAANVVLKLEHPIVIYSRKALNALLLRRAESAGAQLEKTRVTAVERSEAGWSVSTKSGKLHADHCVLALGARNPLRQQGTQLGPNDTMFALGYYVPGERTGIDIQFLPRLAGYIWVFPRCGHLSVGICGKGESAQSLRRRLEIYMQERGLPVAGSEFYSHLLPCLDISAWKTNRVSGERWTGVGDAAGLVDPITGEGLYYALRSADLASASILATSGMDDGGRYRKLLQRDFMHDLEFGSRLAKHIFSGKFLFGSVPTRMVQFTRRSARFRSTIQDLFAGTQNYLGLKRRLLKNLNGSLLEVALSFGNRRVG